MVIDDTARVLEGIRAQRKVQDATGALPDASGVWWRHRISAGLTELRAQAFLGDERSQRAAAVNLAATVIAHIEHLDRASGYAVWDDDDPIDKQDEAYGRFGEDV